jgi:hypothetical protein
MRCDKDEIYTKMSYMKRESSLLYPYMSSHGTEPRVGDIFVVMTGEYETLTDMSCRGEQKYSDTLPLIQHKTNMEFPVIKPESLWSEAST